MKFLKINTLIFILSFSVFEILAQTQTPPVPGKPKDFVLPSKTVFSLSNGLKVTMVDFGSLPKVVVQVEIRTGNLDEKEDEVWLADLTTGLLKEGTKTRDATAIATTAAGMGGSVNTSVGLEKTTVSGEVLSEFGPDLIALLADIIQNPAFPEKEFERLKKDYIRNLSIQKTQPQSLAGEKFAQVMYGNHPFGRYFPEEEKLQTYQLEQVKTFYQSNFGAKRTHIYVAGVFDAKAVKNAIEKQFKNWKTGKDITINIPEAFSAREIYLIDRPDAPQSTIHLGLPVIDPRHEDYLALFVTNTLLGGYFSSRIVRNIREDKGYTYSPSSSITSHYRDAFWRQQADVSTEVTGASLKEIFYEIERLQKEPPPLEELKGVQNYRAGIFVLQNSSPSYIISQLSFLNLHGLDDSYLTDYVKNVHALTPEDIQRMAQKYLMPEKMTLVIVGDVKKVRYQVQSYGEIVL